MKQALRADTIQRAQVMRGMRRRVAIIQSVLKQYRVPFYTKLSQKLAVDGIDLSVLYGEPSTRDAKRGDNVTLSEQCFVKVESSWLLGERMLYQRINEHLRDTRFVILEHATKYVANYGLILEGLLGRRKIAFWGHGRNRQARTTTFVDVVRRQLLSSADWYFAYTRGTAEYVMTMGVSPERTTVVQNATDTHSLMREVAAVSGEELAAARARLGISASAPVGLFVGSLYPDKLLPFLLESASKIRMSIPDFHLVIAGAGPDSHIVQEAAQLSPSWIHYIGPVFGCERAVYFRLASVFLNPGLVGLAILDAFAAGLPVITTEFPFHSPEIEYLSPNINGLLTSGDTQEFAYATTALLSDKARLETMRQCSLEAAQQYSMEAMVHNFHDGIVQWMST